MFYLMSSVVHNTAFAEMRSHCSSLWIYSTTKWPNCVVTSNASSTSTRHYDGLTADEVFTLEKVFICSLFQRICSMLAQTGQQAPGKMPHVFTN